MPETQLLELHAEGLGPIDVARLEFAPGFNVLTGETGAGKTLLIGALSLCLGGGDDRGVTNGRTVRASALFVRDGEETAFVRETSPAGRLRGSLDGLTTSARALRERSEDLIVIHGQHDSLRLRDRSTSLRLLDEFGHVDDAELREIRSDRRALLARREEFGGDEASRAREMEFLRFQIAEIEAVSPAAPEELEVVLERLRHLSSLRDHHDDLRTAVSVIDGDDDAALLQLARATKLIPSEGRLGEIRERLLAVADETRELVRELQRDVDGWAPDEDALSELEGRVTALQGLARKFGGSLSAVFAEWSRMAAELDRHERAVDTVAELDRAIAAASAREALLAAEVRERRTVAAHRFAAAVRAQFARVALAGARFDVTVAGDDGSTVEFLFAPNEHVTPGPVQSLASGGELARVLLAISLETVSDGVVAVFDEIDAGIGGSVAQQIGDCLKELSTRQQVIVVTHLASVAAKADRQFVVASVHRDGRTTATVTMAGGDERVSEIARMLAGESSTHESRALAQRLLGDSQGP